MFCKLMYPLFTHCKVVAGDGLAIGTQGFAQLDFVSRTSDFNHPELLGIPVLCCPKVETLEEKSHWKLIDTAKDSPRL